MSSGEADAGRLSKPSLDDFTKCSASGCEIDVYMGVPGEARCHHHGGRDGIPEVAFSSSDGSLIYARHLRLPKEDCE